MSDPFPGTYLQPLWVPNANPTVNFSSADNATVEQVPSVYAGEGWNAATTVTQFNADEVTSTENIIWEWQGLNFTIGTDEPFAFVFEIDGAFESPIEAAYFNLYLGDNLSSNYVKTNAFWNNRKKRNHVIIPAMANLTWPSYDPAFAQTGTWDFDDPVTKFRMYYFASDTPTMAPFNHLRFNGIYNGWDV